MYMVLAEIITKVLACSHSYIAHNKIWCIHTDGNSDGQIPRLNPRLNTTWPTVGLGPIDTNR